MCHSSRAEKCSLAHAVMFNRLTETARANISLEPAPAHAVHDLIAADQIIKLSRWKYLRKPPSYASHSYPPPDSIYRFNRLTCISYYYVSIDASQEECEGVSSVSWW